MDRSQIRGETERLLLRPYEETDYREWINQQQISKPAMNRYDAGWQDMSDYTEGHFKARVEKLQLLAADDKVYAYGVFRKEDGACLGNVDVATLMRDEFQWAMIGYALHNQHWGQGYGREAVNKLLDIAFTELHFHRVEAHINLDNPTSIALAESVGMSYECTRKEFTYEFQAWTDNLIYFKNAPNPAPPVHS